MSKRQGDIRDGGDRMAALDGLRGFAALAILLFHMEGFITPGRLLGHGYLAVDLFFVLSGFVVARRYGRRLDTGMSFRAFAAVRMRRLWPMALVGLVLSLLVAAHPFRRSGAASPGELAAWATFGALLLPNPFAPAGAVLWINGPAWSLHFELLANALFAAQHRRWRGAFLFALIGLALALLVVWACKLGTLGEGAKLSTYSLGLARVLYGFPAGVLICRLHETGRLPRLSLSPWLVIGVSLLILAAPEFGRWQGLADIAAVAVVFPALVACAVSSPCGAWSARLFGRLSELSYPLYTIHPALIAFLVAFAIRSGLPQPLWTAASLPIMAATAGAAWLAHRWIERPLMRRARKATAQLEAVKPGAPRLPPLLEVVDAL